MYIVFQWPDSTTQQRWVKFIPAFPHTRRRWDPRRWVPHMLCVGTVDSTCWGVDSTALGLGVYKGMQTWFQDFSDFLLLPESMIVVEIIFYFYKSSKL